MTRTSSLRSRRRASRRLRRNSNCKDTPAAETATNLETITPRTSMTFPITTSFRFLAPLLLAVAGAPSAFAASGREAAMARFDRLVIPAVETAGRQSGTNLGGNIAWGQAYQLAALVEMFDVTRDAKYAQLIVKLSDWMADARDDRHGFRDEVRDRVLPAWSSTGYSKGKRYVWAVHTGMIVAPMARFAAIVRREPTLTNQWGADASRLLKVAEEAVAAHTDEYRDGPRPDEGHVYCPYLKKHLPLNMQNALARAWLAIDDATQTPKHRERLTRLAQFLKNRLRPMDDGAYVWAYWPALEGVTESFEDISHAAINVDFMVRCFEHGLVFLPADMARLEKTLLVRVLVADDQISNTVGGGEKSNTYRSAVLRWGRLGRHSTTVRDRLARLSELPEFAADITSLPAGIVYLKLPPPLPSKPASK